MPAPTPAKKTTAPAAAAPVKAPVKAAAKAAPAKASTGAPVKATQKDARVTPRVTKAPAAATTADRVTKAPARTIRTATPRTTPRTTRAAAPVKAPTTAPVKTTAVKAPVKKAAPTVAEQTTALQVDPSAPVKTAAKAPAKRAVKAAVKAPVKAPAKAPTKAPVKVPTKAPVQAAAVPAPVAAAVKAPARVPLVKTPAPGVVPAARKAPVRRTPATTSARSKAAPVPAAVSYEERPWLGSYPDGVPRDYEFPKVPLTRLLDDASSSFPDHVALAFLGAKTTYKQLRHDVDALATGLAGLGVGKGDRVAIVLPNCPQNVVTFFAVLRLGAVVVEHNPLYTEVELRHQLGDCGAKVVVCLDRVYDKVAKVAAVKADTAVEHVVVTSLVEELPTLAKLKLSLPLKKAKRAKADVSANLPKGAKVTQYAALLKAGKTTPARQTPVDPMQDLALLQYTGGTTGLSKGAMLTHHNLVSNVYMNRLWDTEAKAGKEVTLAVLPLFHAYGLTVAMTNTILLGGTLVLLPRFDLDLVFKAVDDWKPTLLPGVPPIYKAMADSPKAKAHDLKSIRLCVSGAMHLTPEVAEQFRTLSGATLIEGYGMTETSPVTHANPTQGPGKEGIGLPLPGTRVKIVAQDDANQLVEVGQPGEMAIAGPQVFQGYWGREHQDGVFTEDGYVLTGDVAVMDHEGWFRIVDRKKELIIAGGFNIYPSEVEDVLREVDGVEEVAVIGVPDKYRGETVKAFVVRSPGSTLTEQDVLAAAAESLTAYKVPKLVEFRDDLPRTAVGKVLRRVLVDQEKAAAGGTREPARKATRTVTTDPEKVAPAKRAAAKKAPARKVTSTKVGAPAPVKTAVKKASARKAPPRS